MDETEESIERTTDECIEEEEQRLGKFDLSYLRGLGHIAGNPFIEDNIIRGEE